MLRRGQAGECKTGGQRLPSPFLASLSRAASVYGFERAHGFRRRKSTRSTGRRSRSTEPLPGVQAYRRLRRMSSRAGLPVANQRKGGETCRGNRRRAAFPGEGACGRVASALVSAARVSTLPSRLAKPTSLSTRVAWRPSVSVRFRPRPPGRALSVSNALASCGWAGLPRSDGSLASALSPPPARTAAETASCLSRQGTQTGLPPPTS